MSYKRAHAVTLAIGLAAWTVAGLTTGVRAAETAQYGRNLIVNGNAEADAGAPDDGHIVKPTGWETTGEFTAVKYGADGGFPDASSPGPSDRGQNLFEGGNVEKSTATQTVSLTAYSGAIDAGTVRYTLSGWLGGFEEQADYATVTVAFVSESGATLGRASLGPVTPAQRKGNTGLVRQQSTGIVPKGARNVAVTIDLTRVEGTYNDGAADDLSLVLTKAS